MTTQTTKPELQDEHYQTIYQAWAYAEAAQLTRLMINVPDEIWAMGAWRTFSLKRFFTMVANYGDNDGAHIHKFLYNQPLGRLYMTCTERDEGDLPHAYGDYNFAYELIETI